MDAVLLQYGPLGVIALVCFMAIRTMYNAFQKSYDRERERADHLAEELRLLNEAVRGQYLTTLSEATRAIADALATVRRG